MTYDPGEIVVVGGDSILQGLKACVIKDFGETVYVCVNGSHVGADYPVRDEFDKDMISSLYPSVLDGNRS